MQNCATYPIAAFRCRRMNDVPARSICDLLTISVPQVESARCSSVYAAKSSAKSAAAQKSRLLRRAEAAPGPLELQGCALAADRRRPGLASAAQHRQFVTVTFLRLLSATSNMLSYSRFHSQIMDNGHEAIASPWFWPPRGCAPTYFALSVAVDNLPGGFASPVLRTDRRRCEATFSLFAGRTAADRIDAVQVASNAATLRWGRSVPRLW